MLKSDAINQLLVRMSVSNPSGEAGQEMRPIRVSLCADDGQAGF